MIHRDTSRRRYTALTLAAVLSLALLLLALWQRGGAASAAGSVSVYPGVERSGLSRRACGFQDGIFIQRGEVEGTTFVVTDPLNREYYRSAPIPELEGYAVQSLICIRSAQTGQLVVVVGGFRAGSGGQQSLTLATDYAIREPITHEQYLAGQR